MEARKGAVTQNWGAGEETGASKHDTLKMAGLNVILLSSLYKPHHRYLY